MADKFSMSNPVIGIQSFDGFELSSSFSNGEAKINSTVSKAL